MLILQLAHSKSEEDIIKVNVVPNLSNFFFFLSFDRFSKYLFQKAFKNVCMVASVKLLQTKDPDSVVLRSEKTGKAIDDDESLQNAIQSDGNSVGALNLLVSRRGQLFIPNVPDFTMYDNNNNNVESENESTDSGRKAKIAMAGNLLPEEEDDEWLGREMIRVLKMHADGRMFSNELFTAMKFSTKHPERISLARMADVAVVTTGIQSRRNLFMLDETDDSSEEDKEEFVFGDKEKSGDVEVEKLGKQLGEFSWENDLMSPDAFQTSSPTEKGKKSEKGKKATKRRGKK